jgi:glutamate synthase domain-containing protein 2
MIVRVRRVIQKPGGFKAVLSRPQWFGMLFALLNQRGLDTAADFITIDSSDGGTGAASMSLMADMGLPIRHSLPILIDKLNEYALRDV